MIFAMYAAFLSLLLLTIIATSGLRDPVLGARPALQVTRSFTDSYDDEPERPRAGARKLAVTSRWRALCTTRDSPKPLPPNLRPMIELQTLGRGAIRRDGEDG
jgi:hypothetical protein